MNTRTRIICTLLVLLATLATGCGMLNPAAAPTSAPVQPVATMAPAQPTVGALDVVTATPERTDVPDNTPVALASPTAPAAPPPTQAPVVAATATMPQAAASPAPAGGLFSNVKIYLVAINDNGVSGPKIGCNDSLVAVDRPIPQTNAPLTAALNQLLSLHERDYGQSGLVNALYQSNLQIQSVAIVNGLATIKLTGQLQSGGVCDDPRIINQLDYTARQFPTVRSTAIYVNGKPIQTLLSGKGQ